MGNRESSICFTDEGNLSIAPAQCALADVRHVQRSGDANIALSLVSLKHFHLLRVVGKGAFGKVRIVERKDTGLQFALKYM